jgi:hypothetical protein
LGVGIDDEDVDTLFTNSALQPGGKASRHRRPVIQDMIDLDQQIDVSTSLLIIDSRTEQAYSDMNAEKLLSGGMDGLDLSCR